MAFPVFSFTLPAPLASGRALILNRVSVGLRAGRYNVFVSPLGVDPAVFIFNLKNQHVPGQSLVIHNVPVDLPAVVYDVYVYQHVLIEGGGGFSILRETGGYFSLENDGVPMVFASSV